VWSVTGEVHDEPWGVTAGYRDVDGRWRATHPETRAVLLDAMGVGPDMPPAGPAPVRTVRVGERQPLDGPAEIRLEDGAVLRAEGTLPPDLPPGYHELRRLPDGSPVRLIVAPACCVGPEGRRTWGWTVQLYALWSRASWGMGDFGDLSRLARWSARVARAGLVLVNPVDAVLPVHPQQPSPYSPSSRRFLNPLYLRVEDVPGACEARLDLEPMAAAARAKSGTGPIDRDLVFRLKMQALERLWTRFPGSPDFERYCAERGPALAEYAVFCTLAERFQGGWPAWPAEFRHPASPAVRSWAVAASGRLRFHQWIQWLLDQQLARAAAEIRLVRDLAVGVDPDGADAWTWQDVLARGVSIGAPPDAFNPAGQDWGLPPFVPHRLRQARYEPFIETVRAALRHAGGLRIDHVMGLFRLFWVPWSAPETPGAYVRYPAADLLAILALESHRAGAVIVGEDLGTVEDEVRATLAARRILSYRLLWFEAEPPARYPPSSLAAASTHDLPTIAGVWTGADLADQRAAGLPGDQTAASALRDRLRAVTGVAEGATVESVVARVYERLAEAPSAWIVASLDDALGALERPNLPGTTTERPNWALPLPEALETIEEHPLVGAVARALAGRGEGAPG
jgi:4-alpha-glucanotransferase